VQVKLHSPSTSALDRGGWSTTCPGHLTLYPFYIRFRGPQSRAGRVWRGENQLPLPEFETWTVQPVVSCYKYTEYAIHTLIIIIIIVIIIIIIIISAQLHFNICKEIMGTVGQTTLVRTCTKISRNNSRREGNHTVESTSANRQNRPQQ
jgi:hypothetical protein